MYEVPIAGRFATALFAVLVVGAGCSSTDARVVEGTAPGAPLTPGSCNASPVTATAPNSFAAIGDTLNDSCSTTGSFVSFSGHPTGAACTSPTDCTPICCPCADGAHEARATWCNNGTCAAPSDVCCAVLGSSLRACGQGTAAGAPLTPGSCNATPVAATAPNSFAAIGDTLNDSCSTTGSQVSFAGHPTGAACTSPTDCTPICCPCADGAHEARATWCNNGTCAAPSDVCCAVLGSSLRACGQ